MPKFIASKWNGETHFSISHARRKRNVPPFGTVILEKELPDLPESQFTLDALIKIYADDIAAAEKKHEDNQANTAP